MAQLVFLTGAPGSGKSTLARLLVDGRPLALLLDLDTLRAQLGDWKADPTAAGIRARQVALAAARAQLEQGGDVVVPQFLRRPELIAQFQRLAADVGAAFVLVALVSSANEAA
jgi:predicted kinase